MGKMYGADGKRVDGSMWSRDREKAMNILLVIDNVLSRFCRDRLLHRRREQCIACCMLQRALRTEDTSWAP